VFGATKKTQKKTDKKKRPLNDGHSTNSNDNANRHFNKKSSRANAFFLDK